MPTLNKLEYLDETKHQIKDALNTDFNCGITNDDTFRSYADKIKSIYTNWPKVTAKGTELSFVAKNGKMVLEEFGNTQQTTYTGKNLFDINSVTSVTNGSISNQIITSDETSATNYSVYPYFSNISLSSGTYYLSMDIRIKTGTGTFNKINDSAIEWTEVSKPTISSNFQRYVYSHTYTENTSLNHILIQFTNSTNAIYEIKNIMLSTSSDTTYEPYVGGTPSPNPDYPQQIEVVTGNNTINVNFDDYSLNLGNYELCKIGDYEDYFFKDRFGTWYINKRIGKIVLNGSESYVKSGQSTETNSIYVLNLVDNNINTSVVDGYSNYFTLYSILSELKTNIGFTFYTLTDGLYNYLGLSVSSTSIPTINDLKTWLSNNNVLVYYVLANDIGIDISSETTLLNQLDALEKAMASTGVNYIGSEHEEGNAPIVLSVTALQRGGN